jgi:hypothetical protein
MVVALKRINTLLHDTCQRQVLDLIGRQAACPLSGRVRAVRCVQIFGQRFFSRQAGVLGIVGEEVLLGFNGLMTI